MIEITDLAVHYGAVVALRGVSLAIQPGEAVSVIGPNGAGMTSLLRCVAGLIKPASGSVTLGDRSIGGKPANAVSRLGIAL